MNCHEARELLSGWLDEALSAEERVQLEAHLHACSDCPRELDRLRQVHEPRSLAAPA